MKTENSIIIKPVLPVIILNVPLVLGLQILVILIVKVTVKPVLKIIYVILVNLDIIWILVETVSNVILVVKNVLTQPQNVQPV